MMSQVLTNELKNAISKMMNHYTEPPTPNARAAHSRNSGKVSDHRSRGPTTLGHSGTTTRIGGK